MPYIDDSKREGFENCLTSLVARMIAEDEKNRAGMMNYCISTLISKTLSAHGTNYALINELIGVLECAKLELYRRVASPYEDTKVQENGDVY
tara:strand:- start:49 stop:324 length:276 start_codon:yes stop_codon:yes gene_type:complete